MRHLSFWTHLQCSLLDYIVTFYSLKTSFFAFHLTYKEWILSFYYWGDVWKMKLQHLLSHEMLDGSALLLESSLNCYTCLQGPISLRWPQLSIISSNSFKWKKNFFGSLNHFFVSNVSLLLLFPLFRTLLKSWLLVFFKSQVQALTCCRFLIKNVDFGFAFILTMTNSIIPHSLQNDICFPHRDSKSFLMQCI